VTFSARRVVPALLEAARLTILAPSGRRLGSSKCGSARPEAFAGRCDDAGNSAVRAVVVDAVA
jgi:hypothetical protein